MPVWRIARINASLWSSGEAAFIRSLSGLGLSIAVAVPLGLFVGWYRQIATLLTPLLELFRNTAALALLPVFVLILGLGETSKIAIILYGCSCHLRPGAGLTHFPASSRPNCTMRLASRGWLTIAAARQGISLRKRSPKLHPTVTPY